LIIFGVGTLVGMLALSTLMELGVLYMVNFWEKAQAVSTFATGLFSLLFGCYVVWRIGFADGLLTGHPHWIPE
jgi:high-affinity nickel-transport protein